MNGLKECPVCKAKCFADMEMCFGCLHRFTPGEGLAGTVPEVRCDSNGECANLVTERESHGEDASFDLAVTVRVPRRFICVLAEELHAAASR